MNAPDGLRDLATERRERLVHLATPDDSPAVEFERRLEEFGSPEERNYIRRARDFAASLDYDHPGQSAAIYLAHPFRVARLYMDLVPGATAPGVATALVHNVFEVTDLRPDHVGEAVGRDVADAVDVLTVDRDRQWDWEYKREYYERIRAAGDPAAPVKVVDKLDNLFMLHLNPSDETRERYLYEIERFLIPLARSVAPLTLDYLSELVDDNRRMGHRPLDASDLVEGGR